MARLGKIIRYHPKFSLGFLRDENGCMTSNPEETLDILAKSSFPGCCDVGGHRNPNTTLFRPEKAEWRSHDRIRKAFADFSPHKSGGPDNIKPIALQNLSDSFIEKLGKIYDASITCRCTPYARRESKVIYIPKMGTTTHDEAKSFRPITLT